MQNTDKTIEIGTYKCGCTAGVFGSSASRYQTIIEMAYQLCRRAYCAKTED